MIRKTQKELEKNFKDKLRKSGRVYLCVGSQNKGVVSLRRRLRRETEG